MEELSDEEVRRVREGMRLRMYLDPDDPTVRVIEWRTPLAATYEAELSPDIARLAKEPITETGDRALSALRTLFVTNVAEIARAEGLNSVAVMIEQLLHPRSLTDALITALKGALEKNCPCVACTTERAKYSAVGEIKEPS